MRYLQLHWRPWLLGALLLNVLLSALAAVNRCQCPPFLEIPGHGPLAGLAIAYLGLAYLLLIAMVAAKLHGAHAGAAGFVSVTAKPATTRLLIGPLINLIRGLDRHDLLLSVVIAVILLPVFAHTHQIRWVNNLSIALAYCLVLFRIVLFMRWKMAASGHSLSLAGQRVYIAYGLGILLLIGLIPTADSRDPFGTQFQLQILCALLAVHLATSWAFGQWRLAKQLQSERTASELALLKRQINPHFLFNTLNNLYGLARENSEQTPAMILRLSALMRHTIYQGDQQRVRLGDEIDYLRDYIELQQLRYAKHVQVDFVADLDRQDYLIAPLLLIVLLENAYKHGVDPRTTEAYVRIELRASDHRLHFEIANDCEEPGVGAATASGIGLANLRRRLQLEYPQRHQLQHTTRAGRYLAQLDLSLQD